MENAYEKHKALQTMVFANTHFVLQWLIGLFGMALSCSVGAGLLECFGLYLFLKY